MRGPCPGGLRGQLKGVGWVQGSAGAGGTWDAWDARVQGARGARGARVQAMQAMQAMQGPCSHVSSSMPNHAMQVLSTAYMERRKEYARETDKLWRLRVID